MWIVDSSVWIDYFGGKVTPQSYMLHAPQTNCHSTNAAATQVGGGAP
jgi:hypothetical protein